MGKAWANSSSGDTVAKTAAYQIVPGDVGKLFLCNGSFALTLPDTTTVGAGFTILIKNTGSGVISVPTANANDTIDTLPAPGTTIKIYPQETGTFWCDGSKVWRTSGLLGVSKVLLADIDLTGKATANFTTFDYTRFSWFSFRFQALIGAAANSGNLCLRVSTDGGVSFISTQSYNYAFWEILQNNTTRQTATNANNLAVLTYPLSNYTGLDGDLTISSNSFTHLLKSTEPSGPIFTALYGAGNLAAIPNAVSFLCSTANFASGRIKMYGER